MARTNVHLEGATHQAIHTMVDVYTKREDGATELILACCKGHAENMNVSSDGISLT